MTNRFSSTFRTSVGVALLLVGVVVQFQSAAGVPGMDFWRPWALLQLYRQGWNNDIYSVAGRSEMYQRALEPRLSNAAVSGQETAVAQEVAFFDQKGLGYNGVDVLQSPFLLSTLRPFAGNDYRSDHDFFLLISVIGFGGAIFLMCRLLSSTLALALGVAGGAMLMLKAQFVQLHVLNINDLQLLFLALFLWGQHRGKVWAEVAGGVMLALAVTLKPNALLVLPSLGVIWAGDRLWRKIAWVGAGFVSGTLLAFLTASLVVPAAKWTSWLQNIGPLLHYQRTALAGNISFATIVSGFAGMDVSRGFLLSAATVVTVVALRPFWQSSSTPPIERQLRRTWLGVGAGIILMLLSARLVWMHYLVLLAPAFLYFVVGWKSPVKSWQRIFAVTIMLLPWLGTRGLKNRIGPSFSAILAWDIGLVILFAWIVAEIWRSGEPKEMDTPTPEAVPSG